MANPNSLMKKTLVPLKWRMHPKRRHIFFSKCLVEFLRLFKPGWGALNFFQVGVCGPDFRSVGLANWYLPLKRGACELKISNFGGLWAENFQIWALVSWNLGEIWGCRGYNFQIFSKGVPVNWSFCLKWDPCELQERREKGVFRAAHPAPF